MGAYIKRKMNTVDELSIPEKVTYLNDGLYNKMN